MLVKQEMVEGEDIEQAWRWQLYDSLLMKFFPLGDTSLMSTVQEVLELMSRSSLAEEEANPLLIRLGRILLDSCRKAILAATSSGEGKDFQWSLNSSSKSPSAVPKKKHNSVAGDYAPVGPDCEEAEPAPPSERRPRKRRPRKLGSSPGEGHKGAEEEEGAKKKRLRGYHCQDCDVYITERWRNAHRLLHQGIKVTCEHCPGITFPDQAGQQKHLRIVHGLGVEETNCPICNKVITNMIHGGSVKTVLNHHIRTTHGDGSVYPCSECSKTFKTKNYLYSHRKKVHGERTFCCEVCGKRFKSGQNLNDHRSIHSAVKPFGCSLCEKRFTQKGYLKTHMRFHTGEKPLKCDLCDESFAAKSMLNAHKASAHPGVCESFPCSHCGLSFLSTLGLDRHIIRKHPENVT
ncbi:unnamed protein product [Cyprideis torosa]|uniref:Uncharacterized protein n=1 Tax=Cyprideis torosa TaxID=163714 RepID=A0A7R8WG52_9CRUS|nr:unnamed protein product [Cyprideis torosa]CAG0897768.1 unnamed protein product [Cyprideis torosa]